MGWITFLKWHIYIYIFYYGILLIFDWIRSKSLKVTGESITYDFKDLSHEEVPAIVSKSNYDFKNTPIAHVHTNQTEAQPELVVTNTEETVTEIKFKQAPEGQGIPMREFFLQAQRKAQESSKKLQL